MEYEILKPIKSTHVGCLCCPGNESDLCMDTVLYTGFGGWSIHKNGELYYMGDQNTEWEDEKKLSDIEKEAALDPDNDWRAKVFLPLRGATYQRQNGKWILVDENIGFA